MKFKCCESILSHLVINPNDIQFCCSTFDKKLILWDKYDGSLIDINDYIEKRNTYIKNCKSGNIPEICLECPFLQEKEWDESLGFKDISASNRTKCSCNCTYCIISVGGDAEIKKSLNSFEPYDIKPVLEHLRKNNMIKPGCNLVIGGGDCSEYPKGELEWLVYFASITKCFLTLLSSGIFYSKAIEQALTAENCELKVSVDAGAKAVYEKIKRVKAFDKVWENLAKYIKSSEKNPQSNVIIKYIIIPGVNDTMEEAKAFLDKCTEVKCKNISINMEFYWMNENFDKPLSENLKNTLLYFHNVAEKYNISFDGNISSHIKKFICSNILE